MVGRMNAEDVVRRLHGKALATAQEFLGVVEPMFHQLQAMIDATRSVEAAAKFNPYWMDEPRNPAGSGRGGGRWTDGGVTLVGDTPSRAKRKLNVTKTIEHLHEHASVQRFGEHRCAAHVREALAAGGIDIDPHPIPAKDYGPFLERNGFERVTPTPASSYEPQIGDVVVIQAPSSEGETEAGHIAIFDGEVWFSDFRQRRDIWPGPAYRRDKPSYAVYRYPNLIL